MQAWKKHVDPTIVWCTSTENSLFSFFFQDRQEELIQRIETMLSLKMTVADVARATGVSHQTVYRKIAQYGIPHHYSDISEDHLRQTVIDIKTSHPSSGEVFITGHL